MAPIRMLTIAFFALFVAACADEVENNYYNHGGHSGDTSGGGSSGGSRDGSVGSHNPDRSPGGTNNNREPDPYLDCSPVEIDVHLYSGDATLDMVEGEAIDVLYAYTAHGFPVQIDGTRCVPYGQQIMVTVDNYSDDYSRISIHPRRSASRPIAVSPPSDYCVEPRNYQGYLLVIPPNTYGYTIYVYPMEEDGFFQMGPWQTYFYDASNNLRRGWIGANNPAYVDTQPGACSGYDPW